VGKWASKLVDAAKTNDTRFAALWDGDTSAYKGDQSAADQALCNILAPRCDRDPKRIDSIFRWSELMRPKWDEKHDADGHTYGEMTIAKALDGPSAEKNEARPARDPVRVRTLAQIVASTEEPPAKVVDRLVEEGGISLLIARQKAGKSMLGLQLAIDVANGADFLSLAPTAKGPVLYVDYESRSHILKARGSDFGRGFDLDEVHIANWESIAERNLGLDGEYLELLKDLVARLQPRLLIIDPLRLATQQDLEDDRAMVKALEGVAELFSANPQMGIR
jgi:hypothetical protein